MSWKGVITDAGAELLEQWESGGHTLRIDGATVGSGSVAESGMKARTALVSEEAVAQIISAKPTSGGTTFKVQIPPAEDDAYTATEIGLWAHIDNGQQKLLAYHQDADGGIPIPSAETSPDFVFAMFLTHAISNASEIAVTIDPNAFVSQSTLDGAIAGVQIEIDDIQAGIDAGISQAEVNELFT